MAADGHQFLFHSRLRRLQLIVSLKLTLHYFSQPWQGGMFGQMGFILTIVLVLYQLYITLLYLISVRAYSLQMNSLREPQRE